MGYKEIIKENVERLIQWNDENWSDQKKDYLDIGKMRAVELSDNFNFSLCYKSKGLVEMMDIFNAWFTPKKESIGCRSCVIKAMLFFLEYNKTKSTP